MNERIKLLVRNVTVHATVQSTPLGLRMQIVLETCFCLVAYILVFALNPAVMGHGILSPASRMRETPGMRSGRSRQQLLLPRSMVNTDHTAAALNTDFNTTTNRHHHWPFMMGPCIRASKIPYKLTWSENARKAGIGIKAAIKKAVTLLIDVRATLAPVRFKHSPVLSCKTNDVS